MVTAIKRRGVGAGYWQRWGERNCPIEYPTNLLFFSTTVENAYDDYADDVDNADIDEYADLEKFENDEEYKAYFRPKS
jgi:hypothetical protein